VSNVSLWLLFTVYWRLPWDLLVSFVVSLRGSYESLNMVVSCIITCLIRVSNDERYPYHLIGLVGLFHDEKPEIVTLS
jgi:hypothetical protein